MKHVMVDVETMGHAAGCAIVAIGAVAFDPWRGVLGEVAFSQAITLASNLEVGLRVDASTVDWWLQRDKAAQVALFENRTTLICALRDFAVYSGGKGVSLWSHATFDVPILGAAYEACQLEIPWSRRLCRDLRTLVSLAYGDAPEGRSTDMVVPVERIGTYHQAADDAAHQARVAIACYDELIRSGIRNVGGQD